ncbi:MAG: VOC family protein [Pseudomonadota bacterium]
MTRLHIHVGVKDVAASKSFYATLFGQSPSFEREDYAKWSLDDPKVNFVISTHCGGHVGVDHVGLEADTPDGLGEIARRLKAAGQPTFDEDAAHCCYANSQKTWVADPGGLRWETFYSEGQTTDYGEDAARDAISSGRATLQSSLTSGPACCG